MTLADLDLATHIIVQSEASGLGQPSNSTFSKATRVTLCRFCCQTDDLVKTRVKRQKVGVVPRIFCGASMSDGRDLRHRVSKVVEKRPGKPTQTALTKIANKRRDYYRAE